MNCIKVISQFLLTKVLRWARIVRTLNALPTAVIHLLVNVVLNVLGVIGRNLFAQNGPALCSTDTDGALQGFLWR
jgi:hypothetical protein